MSAVAASSDASDMLAGFDRAAAGRDADGRVPATILTGFLGSGKTTLLNHILTATHGKKLAVIENEFGEVGIDDALLAKNTKMQADEELIEMMNGCICCTVRQDLIVVLNKLAKRVNSGKLKLDGIIIETTGMADPAPVAQTFFVDDQVKAFARLHGIVTLVDAKHITQHLDEEKPEGVENEAVEQVAFADRLLLNKIDLVPEEDKLAAIEKRLKTINPTAQIIRSQQSKVEPLKLININSFSLDRVVEMDPGFLNTDEEHEHDPTVTSISHKGDFQFNLRLLEEWIGVLLRKHGANLYRYKGVLAVAGMDQKFVFQGVGMLFKGAFMYPWPENEPRESRFVFIGKHLDAEELKQGFKNVECSKELRFKVGDKVLANVGTWTPGTIIRTWDEGNPYRVELEDGKKTNVWGPVDNDDFIKAM